MGSSRALGRAGWALGDTEQQHRAWGTPGDKGQQDRVWGAPGDSETGTRGQGGGSSPRSSLMGSLFLSHFVPQFPSSCPSA